MTSQDRPAHSHGEATPAIIPVRRRAFAFDMDGVIYRGPELIDGAAETVATVRNLGLPVFFITNNSRETPVELAGKLQALGIDAGPEEIVSAVVATVTFLEQMDPRPAEVLVMGSDGLAAQIERAGFKLASWDGTEAPDAVVVGLDLRLSYDRLTRASRAIGVGGASFIVVNSDPNYPAPGGPAPGSGAIAAAVEAACGTMPTTVGKPSPHMFQTVLARARVPAEDLVVVGDMLEADVAGARALGAATVLVLTGSTSREEVGAAPPDKQPDYLIDNLRQLPLPELLAP